MNAMPIGETCPSTLQTVRPLRSRRRNAESGVQNHVVKSARSLRFAAGIVMVLPIAVLVAGCQERLAQRDAYFAPLSGLSVSLHSETEHMVNYHRALQAARHGCLEPHRPGASPDDDGSGGMTAEGAEGDGAHARLCGSSGLTHAAHGAPLNGYRRWVGDRVRPLPAPSETASSIGSGS